MDGQTAMLDVATDIYSFGTKLHNVRSVLNCGRGRSINHCLMGELGNGGITPRNIKLSIKWVEIARFISQSIFSPLRDIPRT